MSKPTFSSTFTPTQVQHVAQLANIPVSDQETQKFSQAFAETLDVVNQLQQLDVSQTAITYQVTGLTNVGREDVAQPDQCFTQAQALANAPKTHQGYFVVPALLKNKDL